MHKRSECCTCGYTWYTGTDGNHLCSAIMAGTLRRLESRVTDLEKEKANRAEFICRKCGLRQDAEKEDPTFSVKGI